MTAGPQVSAAPEPPGGVYALLTDGTTVLIAPAMAEDEVAVRQMHAHMSPNNIYLRFFSISPLAADREASRVTRPPDSGHCALLAWLGSQLVGVASYEPTGKPGVAEIAFAVTDHMHGRGVATLLLDHLVSNARLRGLRAFTAETLADNVAMLRVFANAGLAARRQVSDGVVETTFPLPSDEADQRLHHYLDSVAWRERSADVASLRHLLEPSSVAVVGASRKPGRVGHAILRNIVSAGFAGRVFAVNPHAKSVLGVASVPSVADLPEPPDVAVIAVPPANVNAVADECGRRGAHALVVVTAGIDAQDGAELLATCRRHGMRLVGPNCFGIAIPPLGLNATFAAAEPPPGSAGLVVQSGGIGIAVLEHLTRLGIGVSSFASVGDKYDVSSNDMLMWWEQDKTTKLALLYVESFGSPRRFAQTARRVGRQFPVLTVIGGRSAAGQRAAASHTAAAATPLVTQEALFGQAGVIATTSLGELVDAAALLASQPLPAGNRVAIVSNAGGAGVLAADACGDNDLKVATLSEATQQRLRRLLPSGAAVAGPVDTSAAVSQRAFRSCLERAAKDDGVDAVMAITVPTALGRLAPAILTAKLTKPLVAVMLDQQESVRLLRQPPGPVHDHGEDDHAADRAIPSYLYPERAARALGYAARYSAWRSSAEGTVPDISGIRRDDARQIVARFLAGQHLGGWLPPDQVADLLACYGIKLVPTLEATSPDAAVRAVSELDGGPVVMKADVAGLVHKSDAGAVLLDLRSVHDVKRGYAELSGRFGADLRKVLIQPMITDGVEVLIGVVHEPVFGPLVVFGLGGVATDVLGDHAARLTPLTDVDAEEMIRGIRAAPLLYGHRGSTPVALSALHDVLLRVSRLADEVPEIAELDLNPVLARADDACPVDARIRLVPAEPQDPFLRRLR
ncbi:MAG TPA: GNAT family N-acetyltransferase [Streptosporangiaceae bacterium]|nr:GNAT family N-acetyltransferase [Streptosporangiaceae bacterium]